MPLRHETLFNDPTPDGFINLRYVFQMFHIAREHTDFTEDEFNTFVNEMILVAKKMAATWKHLNQYIELENTLIEAEKNNAPIETLDYQHIGYSQDLYLELDEFLVQLKSTLDYLAKLPLFIISKKNWAYLRTFGKRGNDVIKVLRNNIPQKWKEQALLIETNIKEHQPWLEMAIESRDRLNHNKDGGFDYRSCAVVKTTVNSKEKIIVPMWVEDMTVRQYMQNIWHSLMVLVEQFTIGFLSMRFKEGIGFIYAPKPLGSVISPITVAHDNAIEPMFKIMEFLQNRESNSDVKS